MHIQPLQCFTLYTPDACSAVKAFVQSTTLIHIQPTSKKTPVYNVNDDILLLGFHLVIARQTEPAPENIGSDVDSRPLYVSICTASAVTLDRDKRVRPIYRLHMHGLPYSTCYTCYIANLSPSRKKRIISCFMLISAHFGAMRILLQGYMGFSNVTHVTSLSFPSRAQHKERFLSSIGRIFSSLG